MTRMRLLRGGVVRAALARYGWLAACIAATGCVDRSGCSDQAPVGGSLLSSPGDSAFRATAPDTFVVRFATSRGDFLVQVPRVWSPRGADRFYNLVRAGYYDRTKFFRVVPGFVVQWGVHGDPAVNQAWARQCIQDDPVRRTNIRRAVTFAFGAPNTRTTQVFINYGLNTSLDRAGFSPFGEVIEGMEVVDSLYAGYGEIATVEGASGVNPVTATEQGNAYLAREFPLLDSIIQARVVAEKRR